MGKSSHRPERPKTKTGGRPQPARAQTPPASDTDKTFRALAVLLLLAVVAAYANHFFNGFHFDDFHTIVNNTYIRSLRNIPRFFIDGRTFSSLPTNQSYRPLVSTTLAIDYFLGHGNVFFFHLSTFLLFLVQGVVMFFFFRVIFERTQPGPANRFVALAAVGWYLLHPANAETINYIIARSDTLSTLFILLAFYVFIFSEKGRSRFLYLIPFALSCLAKPIGAVFAPLLLLYLFLFEEAEGALRRRLGGSLRKAAPTFAACLLLLLFIQKMDPPSWRAGGSSLFHYVITQPYVLFHYFLTFFAPLHLSADTDWRPLASMADPRFVTGCLFLVALLVAAVLCARRERLRPIAFGLLWFFLTLLPTSLIPLAEVKNDHRLFLPYVGLVLGVCWLFYLLLEPLRARFADPRRLCRGVTVAVMIILAGYGYGTHVRNNVWHTELSLWRDVTIKSPRNGRGLMNYGVALMGKGDYVLAEKYFRRAQKFTPRYCNLYVNMGIADAALGKKVAAQIDFQKAIMLAPQWPGGYYWYARFLHQQQRNREAIRFAQKALHIASADLDARKLLMRIYWKTGQYLRLETLARETLRIFPGDSAASRYLAAAQKQHPHRQ